MTFSVTKYNNLRFSYITLNDIVKTECLLFLQDECAHLNAKLIESDVCYFLAKAKSRNRTETINSLSEWKSLIIYEVKR